MNKCILAVAVLALILAACGVPALSTPAPTVPPASTIALTKNIPLSTATLSPTGTPTPLSTFPAPYSEMSSPALDPVDTRINVKNDLVTAIFYLKDVPSELTFDKEGGVDINSTEYMWMICIDTDNNKNTGTTQGFMAGADYCLSATHIKSSHIPKNMPIQQGVQVTVGKLNGDTEKKISDGTIEVDTNGDIIKLSGKISGVTSSSQLYYEIYDGDYGAMTIASPLFDRIFIEK